MQVLKSEVYIPVGGAGGMSKRGGGGGGGGGVWKQKPRDGSALIAQNGFVHFSLRSL